MNLQNGYKKLYTDRTRATEVVTSTPVFGTKTIAVNTDDSAVFIYSVVDGKAKDPVAVQGSGKYRHFYNKVANGTLKIFAGKEAVPTAEDIEVCIVDAEGNIVLGNAEKAAVEATVEETSKENTKDAPVATPGATDNSAAIPQNNVTRNTGVDFGIGNTIV